MKLNIYLACEKDLQYFLKTTYLRTTSKCELIMDKGKSLFVGEWILPPGKGRFWIGGFYQNELPCENIDTFLTLNRFLLK